MSDRGENRVSGSMETAFQENVELMEALARAGGAIAKRDRARQLEIPDPGSVQAAFGALQRELADDPELLFGSFARFCTSMGELCGWLGRRLAGSNEPGPVRTPGSDRRFRDPAWEENVQFSFLRQGYLLQSAWIDELLDGATGLDPQIERQVRFYERLTIDALAPTNFFWTNPVALEEARRTGGASIRRGVLNWARDIERGEGSLRIERTPQSAFEPGRNVATTRGFVVYENDLMQLIQYEPLTEKAMRRPLLIVPPWINKYYILDLGEKNSFIRWAVSRGMTVFVISWANPDASTGDKGFSDYLSQGPSKAVDVIGQLTGESRVNMLGYCLGGTLTACYLARMRALGEDRVASATFLTTMLDFSDPGELGVFIDRPQLGKLDRAMDETGYLEARHMQEVFNLLRANDLIWTFHINNYLLGKDPPAFDLLYWNADGTRMPRMMHSFYLHNMYLENRLARPGGIELADVPIDLRHIDMPTYFLSTAEDHIAPWKSTFAGLRLLGGAPRFVLAGSGHIAGVINPQGSRKYGYRTAPEPGATPAQFLEQAEVFEGSWWTDWFAWLGRHSGGEVPARPVDGEGQGLEPAPGRYVRVRA
ncbi:MAG: class I poly(R)-hydroxyalkanoic acid synthase [Geminicoccaceae bacterium]